MFQIADQVYFNGKVYTVDQMGSVQQAFCVQGDRFLAVGSNEEMLAYCGEKTERIDLNGKVVLPGLIDSHMHIQNTGIIKLELDLRGMEKDKILAKVAEAYHHSGPGKWILGRGWINSDWRDPTLPSKEELDAVAPDAPVYLKRGCGHAGWANSLGFQMAGIQKNTPDPCGGEILRKTDGSILGIVTDQAQAYFINAVPPYEGDQLKAITLLSQEEYLKNGVTTVHDAGEPASIFPLWEDLYKEKKLKFRIYCMLRPMMRPTYDQMYEASCRYFEETGLRIGACGNHLTVRCFKISVDGSLGARSAWMLEDYTDRPGWRGNQKWTDAQMYRLCRQARRAGFQIACHCIGDAASRQALDTYQRVLEELPDPDHRLRIEHAQVLAPEDIPRFRQLGVIPTQQTVFLRTDKQMADACLGDRVRNAYAWRTLVDYGNILPNGSDSPVESCNPFLGMYCAVARRDESGLPSGGWHRSEALTREEALRSYTMWGAYAAFEEGIKGSIEKGKLADFVIVDGDMMTCPEEAIKDIRVLETVIGGETVYRR